MTTWNITDITNTYHTKIKSKKTLNQLFREECDLHGTVIYKEGSIKMDENHTISITSYTFGVSVDQINLVSMLESVRNKWIKINENV